MDEAERSGRGSVAHPALVAGLAVERAQQRIDLDPHDLGAETGEEPQVADGPVAEVHDLLPGEAVEACLGQQIERPQIGQRRPVARRVVEALVDRPREQGIASRRRERGRLGCAPVARAGGIVEHGAGRHMPQLRGPREKTAAERRACERPQRPGLALQLGDRRCVLRGRSRPTGDRSCGVKERRDQNERPRSAAKPHERIVTRCGPAGHARPTGVAFPARPRGFTACRTPPRHGRARARPDPTGSGGTGSRAGS